MTAHFEPPVIQNNLTGWGPCEVPEKYKDMPYQPFSKSDRLGKVSDWTGATYQDRRYANKYQSQFVSGNQYSYYHEEDESTFHLVDTSRVQKPPYHRGRFRMRGGRGRQQIRPTHMQVLPKSMRDRQRQQRKWQKNFGRTPYNRNQLPMKNREASVTVRPDWVVIEEMDFPRLSKLSLPNVKDPDDLVVCGEVLQYNKIYDRVNVKNEKRLLRIDRAYHNVTTSYDPIVRQLAKTEGDVNVFAYDAVLATIMCCTRSNYSWDLVIQKVGNKIFIDKRDDTEFDFLTVNETAAEPPQEDTAGLNSPHTLSVEATFINSNFCQQVLKTGEEKYKFEKPNPFVGDLEEGEFAPMVYRYRKWDLEDGIKLIARCEQDAYMLGPAGEKLFINVKALNEWDSRYSGGVDWRKKLDTQRGAVLANELKNNAYKLAKWTVQAMLAGSDQIKFGYVSRINVRDSSRHVILGTQQFKPAEFATQIHLSMDNAWGILRCIVDLIMKQSDGKYLIMKDPNKPMIRLYDIPANTFESDEDDSEDDTPVKDD